MSRLIIVGGAALSLTACAFGDDANPVAGGLLLLVVGLLFEMWPWLLAIACGIGLLIWKPWRD